MRRLLAGVLTGMIIGSGVAAAHSLGGTCQMTVTEQKAIIQVCDDGTCRPEMVTAYWTYTTKDGQGNTFYWGHAPTQDKAWTMARRHVARNDYCTGR